MLTLHEVEKFLKDIPADQQEIVLELRNLVAAAAPDAQECIRWGALFYSHTGKGGILSAGICLIEMHAEHVRLAFVHGASLPDPHHLMEGSGVAKRFIRIRSYDDAPWGALEEAIRAAARFDPRG